MNIVSVFEGIGMILIAYAIGSLSFAVLTSRLFGLADPRTYGSKNPGATNMLRSGKRSAALLTLLGDAAKGYLAVCLAYRLQFIFGLPPFTFALAALAVFLGHLWPIFFKFKGGKGVATALGILLGIHLYLGLLALATWIIVMRLFNYSSLAALVTALLVPVYYLLGNNYLWVADRGLVLVIGLMTCLLIYRHLSNIKNLLAGTEGKLRS